MPQNDKIPVNRKKRRKKSGFKYFLLFIFVFVAALISLSYLIKYYSPDVDVTIGDKEALTLSEEDMDMEIKPVDERLKWIQMEDEMSTSNSVRNPVSEFETDKKTELNKQKDNEKITKKKEAPIPSAEDLKKAKIDFRVRYDENKSALVANTDVNTPVKRNTATKIYLGNYSTIEEAMQVQQKVSSDITGITPFIKSINGKYIVQLGSFMDKEKANALISKTKTKGYNPKVIEE